MKTLKKMGRPPASWVVEMAQLNENLETWFDIDDISKLFNVHVNTAKTFLRKVAVPRRHEVINGRTKMKLRALDLKKAAQDYINPWV